MTSLAEAKEALALNRQLQHRLQGMLADLERMQVNLVVLTVGNNSKVTANWYL